MWGNFTPDIFINSLHALRYRLQTYVLNAHYIAVYVSF